MTFYFVYTGNAMRQVLSIPLGLIAFCLYEDKRILGSCIAIALAIGLHWSAIFLLTVPLLFLPFFCRAWMHVAIPIFFLGISYFISDIAYIFVELLGIPELQAKYSLYFAGGRESHVGAIWTKANFWLCVLPSVAFLSFCNPKSFQSHALHNYVVLFLSLVLFGVFIPDFSERFFPALLLILPALVVCLIGRIKMHSALKEATLVYLFFALWVLTLFNSSARETLSYSF